MFQTTITEDNYLRAIFRLSESNKSVSTNALAYELNTTAASVTDMLKKLGEKRLVNYVPYRGVHLTPEGEQIAIQVVRKQMLWELFLANELKMSQKEINEAAPQLAIIRDHQLIGRLEDFLQHPTLNIHGEPLPPVLSAIFH